MLKLNLLPNVIVLRNKSWKPECILSLTWLADIGIQSRAVARDKINYYPPNPCSNSTYILPSMNYFDSDMSNSANKVAYLD